MLESDELAGIDRGFQPIDPVRSSMGAPLCCQASVADGDVGGFVDGMRVSSLPVS